MRLKRVERWTEGKTKIAAYTSAFLVIHAEELYESLRYISEQNELAALLMSHENESIQRLYSNTPNAIAAIGDTMGKEGFPEDYATINDWVEKAKSIKRRRDFRHHMEDFMRQFFLNDFDYSPNMGISSCEETKRTGEILWAMPVVGWTIRILIPCLIAYRERPDELYERARQGDMDAVRILATLDKNVAWRDPKIQHQWDKVSAVPENAIMSQLVRALGNDGQKKVKRQQVKVLIATIIELAFEWIGRPVSRAEIRRLFDAFAADAHGEEIDCDFPDTEDGFSKAISRERKRWGKHVAKAQNNPLDIFNLCMSPDLTADK